MGVIKDLFVKRKATGALNLLYDLVCASTAFFVALALTLRSLTFAGSELQEAYGLLVLILPCTVLGLIVFRAYRGLWRYCSIPDLLRLAKAVALGTGLAFAMAYAEGELTRIPSSFLVLYPVFLLLFSSLGRLAGRILYDRRFNFDSKQGKRVFIAGAGRGGELLLRDLRCNPDFNVVGFIDDDARKLEKEVHGVRVVGTLDELAELVVLYRVEMILVAMPSAPAATLDRIVRLSAQAKIVCRTMPLLAELASGVMSYSRLREITVEDLLRREPIVLDMTDSIDFYRGKNILITGGGGSIGSELCRQVARCCPAHLMILDQAETPLHKIERELSALHPELIFNAVLGSVEDRVLLERLLSIHRPDVIFHAAAYKHVPIAEENPAVVVRNNVLGTRAIADLAVRYGVERFVLISTDKTVNPTSVMGVTKRIGELYCQSLNGNGCSFVTTRFGNVLDSSGSVVPLFREQIIQGKPVTVTDPEVSRYFMLIDEAASLILQAGWIGQGGEIFVLDMGEPVRILDLAERMIRLAGYEPRRDLPIVYIGLRPGEKLHEELFYAREQLQGTRHPKILLASSPPVPAEEIKSQLGLLEDALKKGNESQIFAILQALVPEYQKHEEMKPSVLPALRIVHDRRLTEEKRS